MEDVGLAGVIGFYAGMRRTWADIGKAQTGGALPPCRYRAVDGMERIFGQHAIMAQALDFQQSAVGRKAYFAQLRQVVQPLADVEVVGVVDGRLGSQRPIFLVILLDVCGLVINMQRRVTSSVITRVRNRPGVLRVILRLKISCTSSGRPRSRFSRMTCSKNRRPWTGRSSTWVNENSACRIEMS